MSTKTITRIRHERTRTLLTCGVLILVGLTTADSAAGQRATASGEGVEVGRFDFGKMWTFEYPPGQYFTETYGFEANAEWFERVRLSVLRVPGCSASFVSPNGLVVTNHHCVRGRIIQAERPGENFLDDGFYAGTLEEERRIPGYYADRLIAVQDVSEEIFAALDRATSDQERRLLREEAVGRIVERERSRYQDGDATIRVQVIPLYNGGRYSAYVFRRFTDVRLVAAVELAMGHFGGDPDNFTYPRYALDFAFLRVYDANGEPFQTDYWLDWGTEGVEEDDVVFVVGNPGRTRRLNTVAQLEFQRDVDVPAQVAALEERLTALRDFYAEDPEVGEELGIRTQALSLSNTLKANQGRLAALKTPDILARKRAAESDFVGAVGRDPTLQASVGDALDRIAEVQGGKRELAGSHGAFMLLASTRGSSVVIRRAMAAWSWLGAREMGVSADTVAMLRDRLLEIDDQPYDLELRMLTARYNSLLRHLGSGHPLVDLALGGHGSPFRAAEAILGETVLADSARTARAVAAGSLTMVDPAMRVTGAILEEYVAYSARFSQLTAGEREAAEVLGRARFQVYGTDVPPDGSSSPRITDGVVKGYEYNGTLAPPYTTFFGLYDHYYSYGSESDWHLVERFLPPPPGLDMNTPLNFVSTADTYGGNSGSPAVTPDFKIVGLNFDRNIEGLSRDFIYLPEQGRNIMVDVRAIIEAMDDVYDGDRVVAELITGRLFRSEADADALGTLR